VNNLVILKKYTIILYIMSYLCDRCYYKTRYKSHFHSHLTRKRTCIAKNDISISEVREKYGIKLDKYEYKSKTDFKCNTCDKYFTTFSNLKKHKLSVHTNNSITLEYLYANTMKEHEELYKTTMKEHEELYKNMRDEIYTL